MLNIVADKLIPEGQHRFYCSKRGGGGEGYLDPPKAMIVNSNLSAPLPGTCATELSGIIIHTIPLLPPPHPHLKQVLQKDTTIDDLEWHWVI